MVILFDTADKEEIQIRYGIPHTAVYWMCLPLPAYFDAAEERDEDDEDEKRASGNGQLHQDRIRSQVVILTVRVVAVHQ